MPRGIDMTPDPSHESREPLSSLPPFVLEAYPVLASLSDQQTQWRVSAVYQHNRTLQQELETLSQPQPASRVASSALMQMVTLVQELLDQLNTISVGPDLSGFLRAERQLWVENHARLSALLGTQP